MKKASSHRFIHWVYTGVPLLVGLCLVIHVSVNYYIKAYSDPLNWLEYARHFGSEFGQSKWPYGFALFLGLALKLVGPFNIFLINLPVLMVLLLLVRGLARACAERNRTPDEARWVGLFAFLLMASFDCGRYTYYVNPYRDPLSHVYLLGSILLLIRGLDQPGRAGKLFLSGVLLGLSTGVRETALLLLGPMALYGLWRYRADRDIPFLRTILGFGGGLLLGLSPFFLQTYLATDQLILPAQSFIQGSVVPGMNTPQWPVIKSIWIAFWIHLTENGLWILPPACVGLLLSIRRKNPVFWLIFGAGSIGYFIFYSFYYTFVSRYFYVVFLLASIPAGYAFSVGLFRIAGWLNRRFRVPQVIPPAVAALALTWMTCGQILRAGDSSSKFQMDDARRLQAAFQKAVPSPRAVVYCRRNLCEILRYFTGLAAYPLPADRGKFQSTEERILFETDAIRASGRRIYAVELEKNAVEKQDTSPLKRLFDLSFKTSFKIADFHLENVVPSDAISLYEVLPWGQHSVTSSVPVPPGKPRVLEVDAGRSYLVHPDRKDISLEVNGLPMESRPWKNPEYFDLSASQTGEVSVVLRSDQPLSSSPFVRILPPERPIELLFANTATPSSTTRLSGPYYPATASDGFPRIFTEVRVELPEAVLHNGLWTAEIFFRSAPSDHRSLPHTVSFFVDEEFLLTANYPKDKKVRSQILRLPPRSDRRQLIIRRQEHASEASASTLAPSEWWRAEGLELIKIVLWRRSYQQQISVDIGSPEDAVVLGEGFYDRELQEGKRPVRWSRKSADFHLDVPEGGRGMQVRITASDQLRPSNAPPARLSFRFNGAATEARFEQACVETAMNEWVMDLPSGQVGPENILHIECVPWSPSVYSRSGDDRWLGLLFHHIEFSPQDAPVVVTPAP